MEKISVIRVLQYTGTAEWVASGLARRAVKGSHVVPNGGVIREALLGDPFELITTPAPTAGSDGFGLRAPRRSGKPTWDQWIDNEIEGIYRRVREDRFDTKTGDHLIALLEEVREFANTP